MITPKTRVLIVHNRYLHSGGEDNVFESEKRALRESGECLVYEMEFSNVDFSGKKSLSKFMHTLGIIFNPVAFIQVYKKVKRERIQVVHVHNFYYRASPSIFWAARFAGAKTVMTVHNYRLVCISGYLMRDGYICEKCVASRSLRWGVKYRCFQQSLSKSVLLTGSNLVNRMIGTMRFKVDRYLALSPFIADVLSRSTLKIEPGKIILKPNFVFDIGFVTPDSREDFFLFVGRLSPEKGILELLSVWKTIDAPLKIVGSGPLQETVIEAAAENRRIEYLGFQPQEEVYKLQQSCKALIFPSTWHEGMPMTVLEAKSSGAVVIANKTPNLEYLITHLGNGILYEVDLSAGIKQFMDLSDQEKAQLMIAARDDYRKRFCKMQNVKNLIDLYETLSVKDTH